MKKLLIISILFLPFVLSAQLEVKAYKTRNQYSQDVIRIEIKNTGHHTISIRNGGNLFTPFQQTTIYFLSPEERQNEKGSSTGFDGFYPNRFEKENRKLINIFIKKGETVFSDYSIDGLNRIITNEKKIYTVAYIKYSIWKPEGLDFGEKDIEIEVTL